MKSRNAVHAAMVLAAAAGAIGGNSVVVVDPSAPVSAKVQAQTRNMAPTLNAKTSAAPSMREALLGSGFGGGSGRTHYPKRPPGSVARDKRMARKRRNIRARGAK